MASDIERLAVLIEANTKSYERAMKRIEQKTDSAMKAASRSTKKLDTSVQKLGTSLTRIGKGGAALVAAVVVSKFADLAASSIKAASDVEEMESKFKAVFKGLAGSAGQWARDHAKAVNRSEYALKGYLATLQDTFVPMGFARDEASDLSKTLVKLGVDLASFNNASDDEVIRNLTSAIVGNHEAVRSYGISITEAALKQELLRQGYKGAADAASAQQKAQARLGIIMRSTTDAQGDAERTSDSYANKVKGLDAAWERLKATVGGYLKDAAGPLVGSMADLANATADALRPLTAVEQKLRDIQKVEERLKLARSEYGRMSLSGTVGPTERDRREAARLDAMKEHVALGRLAESYAAVKARAEEKAEADKKAAADAVERARIVVDGLTEELRLSKLTNVQKKISAALDKAGVTARSAEGQKIAALVREAEARKTAGAATKAQKNEVAELIAQLEFEHGLMGLSEADKRVANALRQAGAKATDEQRERIEALVRAMVAEEAAAKKIKAANDNLNTAINQFGGEALSAFDQVVMGSKSASQALADLAHSFAYATAQSALLGTGPLAGLFGTKSESGGTGGLFGALVSGILTPKAAGGPVSGGSPYLVGEKGPELFVPRMNGTIVPNHKMSGSGNPIVINQSFDFRGVQAADRAQIQQQIAASKREAVAAAVQAVRAERSANPGYLPR